MVCNNGYTYGTNGNIGTDNTIIRYNVSINDGIRPYPTKRRGWFSPNMHISGPVKGTKIYNNLIFIPEKENEDIGRTIVEMDNWGGPWPEDTWFANNIFYVEGDSKFIWGKDSITVFANNAYFGDIMHMPDDPMAIFENPEFVDDIARGSGFEVLKNFMLKENSPLTRKGISVGEEKLKNIFGDEIEQSLPPNIGIY